MSDKNRQPAIRFAGFEGDWVKSNFFENIKKVIDFRGRTPKKLGLNWSDKGYLALSALNVKNGYIDFTAECYFGDEELYRAWMLGNELKKGQVLFTTEAPMGNVTRVPDNKKYILSQRTVAFDVDVEKITDEFLAVLLKSPNVFKALESLSSGGTAKGVSQKSLSSLCVITPKAIKEQTTIGNFFQKIDDSIALHKRKHQQTQQLKKAMLTKMFPRNGQTQPEIRLKGFSGDWVEKCLEDLLYNEIKGKSQAERLSIGRVPYIDADYLNGGEVFLSDGLCDVNSDDVLIIWDGSNAGKVYYGFYGALGSTLKAFKINTKHNSSFIYQELSRNEQLIFNCYRTPNIPHVVKNFTGEYNLFIPTLKEQTAIGNFFKQLDDTLSLQAKQIDTLEKLKKALLQKCFV